MRRARAREPVEIAANALAIAATTLAPAVRLAVFAIGKERRAFLIVVAEGRVVTRA